MLLAIDTATRMAGLALYDQAKHWVPGEEVWHSVNRHTVEVMPRLVRLLEQQGVQPGDLDGLVVSQGPGSFTGLRIGLSVAKGLALAHDLPLVGVPTLEVVARPHMAQRRPILAILQAGRRRICVARYTRRRGRWRREGEFQLTTLDELCDTIETKTLFCGEIKAGDVEMLQDRLEDRAIIASPAAAVRRPATLAELGWERLSRGDSDDAAALSPIYLQNPQIDQP
jgi:tRNA threonylcarbamoyladenosine biosynthesis protein TsaB